MAARKLGGGEHMNGVATRKAAESLRAQLSAIAPEKADLIVELLLEAMKTQKSARGRCPKCARDVTVTIQDSVAAVAAIKVFIEQAEGRPGVAGEEKGETLRITRFVTPHPELLNLPLWREMAETGELEALREAILAAGHEVELPNAPARVNGS
jgi:hypothetical protein